MAVSLYSGASPISSEPNHKKTSTTTKATMAETRSSPIENRISFCSAILSPLSLCGTPNLISACQDLNPPSSAAVSMVAWMMKSDPAISSPSARPTTTRTSRLKMAPPPLPPNISPVFLAMRLPASLETSSVILSWLPQVSLIRGLDQQACPRQWRLRRLE